MEEAEITAVRKRSIHSAYRDKASQVQGRIFFVLPSKTVGEFIDLTNRKNLEELVRLLDSKCESCETPLVLKVLMENFEKAKASYEKTGKVDSSYYRTLQLAVIKKLALAETWQLSALFVIVSATHDENGPIQGLNLKNTLEALRTAVQRRLAELGEMRKDTVSAINKITPPIQKEPMKPNRGVNKF